ncbi:MAG: OB-fold domain-containing protein [Candidatus Rokubacteria bacterium]|nr:OB-fold domain-containing protein [Candidatus Rokubacteria bacterium]
MTQGVFRSSTDGEGAPSLAGSRCRYCARVSFPARPICPWCGREDTEPVAVGRRGTIQASAVVYHAPIGFTAPYIVALVELAEGPVVFCPITGCLPDENAVPPGTPVELVVAPARAGGAPVFQFRPLGG